MKLDCKALALTSGIMWGLAIFILTWWIIAFEGSSESVTFLGKIYRGYSVTPLGSVIGLVWGLVDGVVCGGIFAWVYNKMVACCEPKKT
jgi:hypothetical protein